MLVLAQGIATAVAPYLHLGYLSAVPYPPVETVQAPFWNVATVSLGMGALLLSMAAVGRRAWRREALAGVLVCLVIMARLTTREAAPRPPPGQLTKAWGREILRPLRHWDVGYPDQPFPTSLADPRVSLPESGGRKIRTDEWGREFQLHSRRVGPVWNDGSPLFVECWLVSAGPDGRFGTSDDIVVGPG